jgi:hypothetical protein
MNTMSSEPFGERPQLEQQLAPVIPIQRNKGEMIEERDFTDADAEVVVGKFFSELQHPSRRHLKGLELAEFIESQVTQIPGADPSTHQARLSQLISEVDVFVDDEHYDHKATYDPVFKDILSKIDDTHHREDLKPQRHAALKLMELRSTLRSDITDIDESDWLPSIERLFT